MKLGLTLVRIILGALFVGHGAQKLFGSFGGGGPDGTGQFFESLGLSPGRQLATAAGASEAGGGALLTLGLATPLASTVISSTMLTAINTVHRQNGPWVANGGYEYNLMVVALLFALTDLGPGDWSLDEAFGLDLRGPGWAALALAAAIAGSVGVQRLGAGGAEAAAGQGQAGDPATAA